MSGPMFCEQYKRKRMLVSELDKALQEKQSIDIRIELLRKWIEELSYNRSNKE